MSSMEVQLLNQKLDILIDDFQDHKKFMLKVMGGTLFFIASTGVSILLVLIA